MLCLQGRILGQVKGFLSHIFNSDLIIWSAQYQVGLHLFYCDDIRFERGRREREREKGRKVNEGREERKEVRR